MVEETLFTSESAQSRAEIADYLRRVADSLDAGDSITLRAGDDALTLDPPERPTFEVEAERETAEGEPVELSVEFEIEWTEGEGGDGDLRIE